MKSYMYSPVPALPSARQYFRCVRPAAPNVGVYPVPVLPTHDARELLSIAGALSGLLRESLKRTHFMQSVDLELVGDVLHVHFCVLMVWGEDTLEPVMNEIDALRSNASFLPFDIRVHVRVRWY